MSKIHYFQRYSSVENTVTNNTLQLIARIYDHSTATASKFLERLTGQPIEIGIEITQQESAAASVPDGSIIQRSFKILIESKVDSPVSVDQLLRHTEAFGNESQKVLLLLTKQHIGTQETQIAAQVAEKHPGVIFRNVTYEDVCQALDGLFKDHESSMRDLAEDYIEYCNDASLFDQARFLMRVVPCGQSIRLNLKHAMYFQPSDRGYTQHSLVGLYSDKAVRGVLDVKSVFDVDLVDGVLTKHLVAGTQTDEFDGDIEEIIGEAAVECGYEIATAHRFFCGTLVETHFRKTSPGGIQGARLMNLREILPQGFSGAAQVADELSCLTWT